VDECTPLFAGSRVAGHQGPQESPMPTATRIPPSSQLMVRASWRWRTGERREWVDYIGEGVGWAEEVRCHPVVELTDMFEDALADMFEDAAAAAELFDIANSEGSIYDSIGEGEAGAYSRPLFSST